MIRINLLPLADRTSKRKITLPTFSGGGPIAIWAVVVVALFAGMIGAIATLQARSIADLEHKVAEAKKEAAELAPQLERIRKLTKEREEVNKRLMVIAALDKDRYYRVQVLNDLSEQIPRNCWLISLKEQGGSSLTMEGVTFSNYIIADLMNNLGKSDRFSTVDLNIAQEGRILETKVIQFTLQSRITPR